MFTHTYRHAKKHKPSRYTYRCVCVCVCVGGEYIKRGDKKLSPNADVLYLRWIYFGVADQRDVPRWLEISNPISMD